MYITTPTFKQRGLVENRQVIRRHAFHRPKTIILPERKMPSIPLAVICCSVVIALMAVATADEHVESQLVYSSGYLDPERNVSALI